MRNDVLVVLIFTISVVFIPFYWLRMPMDHELENMMNEVEHYGVKPGVSVVCHPV